MIRNFLVIMTAFAAAWWAHAETKRSGPVSGTLAKLAELTVEQSPNIARAKNALSISRLELDNARVVFLPSFDLEAVHGLTQTSPLSKDEPFRSPYRSNLSLVLSESLYDGGISLNKLKIAELRFARMNLEYEQRRDQQLLAMAQAYLDWSASVRQREIDENNRDLLRRQFNILDAQYRQGLKTKRDILRIETEMRRVELDVLKRDNEVDLNFQRLAAAVGVPREELEKQGVAGEEPKPYNSSEPNPPLLKAENHRQAKILKYAHDQSELEVRTTALDYWPRLDASAGMAYRAHDYLGTRATWEESDSFDWQALITLRYNLWDWGLRKRNVELARVKSRNVEDENRQALIDLNTELRDVWNRQREFRENVKMTRELLAIETQSYAILEGEYRNGRGTTYLDLITNLKSLIDARSRYAASYYGLRKQQMLYSYHKGELYEVLLK